jgi:hypothetical protein
MQLRWLADSLNQDTEIGSWFGCWVITLRRIVNAKAQTIEQHCRQGDDLVLVMKSGNGQLHSTAIPGLIIPVEACFQAGANLTALRQLLS